MIGNLGGYSMVKNKTKVVDLLEMKPTSKEDIKTLKALENYSFPILKGSSLKVPDLSFEESEFRSVKQNVVISETEKK